MRKRDIERAYRKYQKFCDAALRADGTDPARLVIFPEEFKHLRGRESKKAQESFLKQRANFRGTLCRPPKT